MSGDGETVTGDVPRSRPQPGRRPRPVPTSEESLSADRPDAGASITWRGLGAAFVVVAALAAFVILNIWLATKRAHNDDVEHARTAAVKAARQRVVAMLSYDYRNIDTYISAAPKNTTGSYTHDFTHLLTTQVAPAARRDQIDTKVSVTGVGVLEAQKNEVTLLVLAEQATTNSQSAAPQHDGTQLEVTMRKTDHGWLVSYLTEI
jgi:Mce-associated membrane protein